MQEIKVDENKLKILKVNDSSDKLGVKHTLFNLPIRGLLIAKSGNGKNTVLSNILMNEEYGYTKIFKGDSIYIFTPNHIEDDPKMKLLVKFYSIPDNNIYSGESDPDLDALKHVYEGLIDEFRNNKKQKPLIIIDDYSSSGKFMPKYSILTKIFSNSRKFQINIFFLSQYYFSVPPSVRNNANVLIVGNTSNKNLKSICDEHNMLKNDRLFRDIFRQYTRNQFDFFTINYTNNDIEKLYLDKDFKPIKIDQ